MADFSEWGPLQSGPRLFDQDAQAKALNALKMQEMQASLQQAPQDLRLRTAQASKAEMDLRNAEAMQKAMQGFTAGKSEASTAGGDSSSAAPSPIESMAMQGLEMQELAQITLASGNVEEFRKLQSTSSQILGRAALAHERESLAKKHAFEENEKTLSAAIESIKGVNSQSDFDEAKMTWMMNHPGQKAPGYFELPFSEKLKGNLLNAVVTKKDQDALAFRREQEARRIKRASAQEAYEKSRLGISAANLRLRERAIANAEKNGGPEAKPAKAPTRAERDEVGAVLKDVAPGMSAENFTTATEIIAGDVQALLRNNPGWTRATAIAKAVAERKRVGDIKTSSGPSMFGFKLPGSKEESTFSGKGSSVASPLGLPKAQSEIVMGKYYTLSDGSIGKATEKGFELEDDDDED